MMKRVLLSVALLVVIGRPVACAENAETPIPQLHEVVLAPTKSTKQRLADTFEDLSATLIKKLSTAYDKTAGRVYTPACLNNNDNRKALLVGTVAAAVVYLAYVAWKKYNTSKEAQDDALTAACFAPAPNKQRIS